MPKTSSLRWGIILVLALLALSINPLTAQAQQCSDLLNPEFSEAEKNKDYDAFIKKYNPCELSFVAVQRLALPYLMKKDWQGAAAVFRKYESEFPGMQKRFAAIATLLAESEEGLEVNNLGSGINSKQGEFRPVISADGSTLYFSRNCGSCDGGEDIFVSYWNGEAWGWASELKRPISTRSHEMVCGLSSGGNTLLIFGNYPGTLGRGDIFYSDRSAECWTEVKQYSPPINSKFFESDAMMSADGKAILFVSERPGGVGEFHKKDDFFHGSYGGNTDIYVAVKRAEGFEVINLGEMVNTPYSEYSPYLHPDGKTLYFSSDGHYGLGGLDVYTTTRLDSDSWTSWSEPVNLGKEINSPFNDWGYQISTDGLKAYFSASGRAEGFGGNDIYSIAMPARAKPKAVVTVSGKVSDPNGKPLAADLRWSDLGLQQVVGENRSDPQSGKYFMVLPAGRQYSYLAEKEGYIGKSEHIDLRDIKERADYTLDIVLYPVEQLAGGEVSIRINNVFFDFDKYELRKESILELERWVDFLKENKGLRAEIHGHTDSVGSDAYNQTLSENRAKAVYNYLVGTGIEAVRVQSKGFGESQPLAINATPAGRQENRRVEIKFNKSSGQ